MNKTTNNSNVTVNCYTCAIYAQGMIIGHVEMDNKQIIKFNSENRGELYAKALLRKEVKTEPELVIVNGDDRFQDLEDDLPF